MIRLILVLMACGFILASACVTDECSKDEQTGVKIDKGEFTHYIGYDTHYYLSGPQQARPPEGMFKAGTRVRLIQYSGSYSMVRSEDGIEAYISSDAMKVLE